MSHVIPWHICGGFNLFLYLEKMYIMYSIFDRKIGKNREIRVPLLLCLSFTIRLDTPVAIVFTLTFTDSMFARYVRIYMITFVFTASITRLHIRFNGKRCDHRHTLNVTLANIVCNRTKSRRDSKCYLLKTGVSTRCFTLNAYTYPCISLASCHAVRMRSIFFFLVWYRKLTGQFAQCNAKRTYCKWFLSMLSRDHVR